MTGLSVCTTPARHRTTWSHCLLSECALLAVTDLQGPEAVSHAHAGHRRPIKHRLLEATSIAAALATECCTQQCLHRLVTFEIVQTVRQQNVELSEGALTEWLVAHLRSIGHSSPSSPYSVPGLNRPICRRAFLKGMFTAAQHACVLA